MNALQSFQFHTHQLNVIVDDQGEPWFIAKHVAEILEYSDAEAMTRKLDADEIQNLQIVGFGNRGVNLINESGLYSAILTSQKLAAKAFKKWVTSEVLPSIRKTGSFGKPQIAVDMAQHLTLQQQVIDLQQKLIGYLQAPAPLASAFGHHRPWAAKEDHFVDEKRAEKWGWTRIGMALGRTGDSCRHRYTRRHGGAQ